MKEIDKVYTEFPYYGSRRIAKDLSRNLSKKVNRKRTQRLMRVMGIEAIYPKPRLSRIDPGHTIYPYLLRGIKASYPNHIWGTDITYIPLTKGWMYLVAIIDWFSRYVVSWQLSDTLAVGFCIEALEKALKIGIPDIHNSDRGSQFTADEYLGILKEEPDIRISMDSRGRVFDNIFTERLWRSVKYEEVYIHDYQSPIDARLSLSDYFDKYNNQRLHQSLDYKTPAEVYYGLT
jgi:putative transposase